MDKMSYVLCSLMIFIFILLFLCFCKTTRKREREHFKIIENRVTVFVISHQGNPQNKRFKNRKDKKYILVTGGHNIEGTANYKLEGNHLKLSCQDKYAALPEKVIMTISAYVRLKDFKYSEYFVKVDSDIQTKDGMNFNKLANKYRDKGIDYGGFQEVYRKEFMPVGRTWHLKYAYQNNKGSKWSRPYTGRYPTKWFQGSQYVLSKNFTQEIHKIWNIDNLPLLQETDVYEDVMIGKLALFLNKDLILLEKDCSVGCIKQIPNTC